MPTIRSVWGITELHPACLVPYELGREPVQESFAARAAHVRAAEIDARLGHYKLDATSGVIDRYIARAARLSRTQVQAWRSRNGVARRPGRPSTGVHLAFQAMNVFGNPRPTPMRTRSAGIQFEPPEYLLRVPLDYDLFARAVGVLRSQGMAPCSIAVAMGVRDRDVAYVVERRMGEKP